MLKKYLLLFISLSLVLSLPAQKKKKAGTPADTTVATAAKPVKKGPKPYKEIITDKASTSYGLFTIHKVEDKWYFELPDSVFNKDIMIVTRYNKTSAGGAAYGGELVNQQVIRWEKGPENTVFMRVVVTINVAKDSASPMYQAVRNSNLNPIGAAFEIKAYGKDSSGSAVIDVSDFFKGDNQVVSFTPATKKQLGLGAIAADRSYIDTIKTFPINTEVRTVKTYSAAPAAAPSPFSASRSLPAASAAGAITLELNSSFLLLPEKPMRKRLFDPRVGYFADDYTVYSDDQQKVDNSVFIVRWRLEPKPEDIGKWKRGELVEPAKQIVYYIDPATPKKWRPYLIQGINDWQAAFEQAGFKNAIIGKEWPEDNPDMSLEDARYSAIRYFASPTENAYGPNVHDPRSGEILESHIGWYHNVMKLLHDWYFVQAAPSDPRARKMEFDDELMGELIRFVSSHEVGHTLGLRHNMGASYATPVEKLRDKEWLKKYGHTVSIMDYARFNYVAQPEDGITDLFPRISVYDKWAIEWGYKPIAGELTEEEEKKVLNKWILAHAGDPMYWFGGEGRNNDPRAQTESLGDDNMKASEYGIKNLKVVMANLLDWTKEEADTYTNLNTMYTQVFSQYNRYINHVIRNIGGIYQTYKSYEEKGEVYEPTPAAVQREAVSFLSKQVFITPEWLLDKNILNKITEPSADRYSSLLDNVMGSVLSQSRLDRMIASRNRDRDAYSIELLYSDLKKGVWGELASRSVITNYRRDLQRSYVNRMITLLGSSSKSDINPLTKSHLKTLRSEMLAAAPLIRDALSRYHLQDLAERIQQALEPKG